MDPIWCFFSLQWRVLAEDWPSELTIDPCVVRTDNRRYSISVNVYYHIGHEDMVLPSVEEGSHSLLQGPNISVEQWKRQAKEFRIGSLGFADSFGILLASLIAMPTELGLCRLQVLRGKDLCKRL
jgi:hypothetical protein